MRSMCRRCEYVGWAPPTFLRGSARKVGGAHPTGLWQLAVNRAAHKKFALSEPAEELGRSCSSKGTPRSDARCVAGVPSCTNSSVFGGLGRFVQDFQEDPRIYIFPVLIILFLVYLILVALPGWVAEKLSPATPTTMQAP